MYNSSSNNNSFSNTRSRGPTAFIGNLSFECVQGDIDKLFSGLKIVKVTIPNDKVTNQPRGIGYVEFADEETLQEALTYNGRSFMGRNIKVDVSVPKDQRTNNKHTTAFSQPRFENRGPRVYEPKEIPNNPPYVAYVGNIALDSTQGDVDELFDGLDIEYIRLSRDRETDVFRGYAYVEFKSRDGLEKALTLNATDFRGQSLKVNVAGDKKPHKSNNHHHHDGGNRRPYGGQQQDNGVFSAFNGQNRRNFNNSGNNNGFGGGNYNKHSNHQTPRDVQPPSEENTNNTESGETTTGQARPQLKLKPRTIQEPINAKASIPASKPSPFGNAKPVDTQAIFLKKDSEHTKTEPSSPEKKNTGSTR